MLPAFCTGELGAACLTVGAVMLGSSFCLSMYDQLKFERVRELTIELDEGYKIFLAPLNLFMSNNFILIQIYLCNCAYSFSGPRTGKEN